MLILKRQARDKRIENSKRDRFLAACLTVTRWASLRSVSRRGAEIAIKFSWVCPEPVLAKRRRFQMKTPLIRRCRFLCRVEKLSQVVSAVAGGLPSLVGVPLTLIQMWKASPELARANATMVVLTVGSLFVVYILGIKRCSKAIAKQKALATAAVTESFFAIRTVQSFDAASQLVERYAELLGGYAYLEMVQQLAFQSLHQVRKRLLF